ncbi:hypothetical protein ABVT39_010479 [Epinephelus coioides]
MKKKGRGTFEEKEAAVDNVGIRAVKWYDNRGVIVASTFASAQPVSTKKQKDLLSFRTSIAQALCMQDKDLSKRKRGRPSSDVEREFEKKRHQGPAKPIPAQEVRSDAVGHWPEVESVQQRCKLPNCKGQTVIKCSKCNVHLCLNKNNNCFREFHA